MIVSPKLLATLGCILIIGTPNLRAEEGGSGHYMPGSTSSFIDALPGKPALAYVNLFTYYNGSASAARPFHFGRQILVNAEATARADTSVLLEQTSYVMLGGTYAAAVAIPYVWLDVAGDIPVGPVALRRSDSANGLGDITVIPFMLGWTKGTDLKYDVRLSIYTPTGSYDANRLANVGKNYWTYEPSASVSWLSSKIGLEVSAFAGLDFNTKNTETDYQTGTQFHLDFTVAEHLPFMGGFVGVGVNGFIYQQLSDDSGAGATLGGFKGRTSGLGPVLSYATKLNGQTDLVTELKWLPEGDVERRLKGDYIWFKLALVF